MCTQTDFKEKGLSADPWSLLTAVMLSQRGSTLNMAEQKVPE